MSVLTWLAPLSSWLVMLHLGVQSTQAHAPSRHGLGLFTAHYAAPLLVVALLHLLGLVDLPQCLGLAVCVLAGTGTSAVPWALREGALPGAISQRLAVGAVVALLTLPLVALAFASPDAALQRFVLTALIMAGAMWLPWQLGRFVAQRHFSALTVKEGVKEAAVEAAAKEAMQGHANGTPYAAPDSASLQQMKRMGESLVQANHSRAPDSMVFQRLSNALGKAATLSVLTLILLIAWRELPRLPQHPELLAACVLLVLVQGIGGAWLDAATGLATTAVIRNLTLATVVLMIGDHASTAMTALAAFGVVMYLGVWPTSLLAKHWREQRMRNEASCADADPPA